MLLESQMRRGRVRVEREGEEGWGRGTMDERQSSIIGGDGGGGAGGGGVHWARCVNFLQFTSVG